VAWTVLKKRYLRKNSTKDPLAEKESSGSPLEGGSRDRGFSVVTGGRPTSFHPVREWGTPWPRAKSRGTAEGGGITRP